MQTIGGAGLLAKQTSEVVLHNGALLAALLKEKTCNGGLDEAVLVPLRMLSDKPPHGAIQILRQLVFHTHVNRHQIGCLVQLVPRLSTHSSGHGACSAVKKADSVRLSDVLREESRPSLGLIAMHVSWNTTSKDARSTCQVEGSFSPECPVVAGRPESSPVESVENLWKDDLIRWIKTLFTAAYQSVGAAAEMAIPSGFCGGPSRSERIASSAAAVS